MFWQQKVLSTFYKVSVLYEEAAKAKATAAFKEISS